MTSTFAERKYWSEWIETAPREEIRALQERKLREHVRYIFAHSRFRFIGRMDDMIKIRAINIFPSAIDDIVRKFSEMGSEFQLVIEKKR